MFIIANYMNPYEILGVSPDDSKKLIKKRYVSLMLKLHPDRVGDQHIAECKRVMEAWKRIVREEEFEENELIDIPQEFRDLGFNRVPSLYEYIGRMLQRMIKEQKK